MLIRNRGRGKDGNWVTENSVGFSSIETEQPRTIRGPSINVDSDLIDFGAWTSGLFWIVIFYIVSNLK